MPIQLNTPFDPGDMDPGKSYTHVEVDQIEFSRDRKRVNFAVNRGYLVGGQFVRGAASRRATYLIQDEEGSSEYTDFMATAASGTLEQTVAAGLYTWLLTKGIFEGAVI